MPTPHEPVDGMRSTLVRPADPAPGHAGVGASTRRDVDASVDEPGAAPPLAGPQRLDRYVLLGELGRGGMGVVYAAYDTTLDRKVAIKLLRDDGGRESHLRMLREARALARLSHPNVVGVYEVGEVQRQVFLAMELVEGVTLRAWLTARARTQAEILAVFLQAAEGLAAAHAAGLVHRDFKPDNVAIGADGRVRVMDFGLARRSVDAPTTDEAHASTTRDPQLTEAGALLGTPAYMAPEQHLGLGVGPPADLYAFAVALYEALHGQRPFHATSTRELSDRVLRGERNHVAEAGRVPAWLQAVVDRGLALEPVDRWPTMAAFSAALRRDPTRRRRLLAAAAAVGLVAAGWFAAQHHRERSRIDACVAEGASIDATWNDAVAARLRADLLATGISFADTTVDRLVPLLTARADAWREARTGACLDAAVHHTWDADTLDRATACLDDRRAQLEAAIDVLSRPDDAILAQAVSGVAELPPIAECRDADRLRRAPPLPADRPALRAARALVGRAEVLQLAGAHAEGLTCARDAVAAAERLGWAPLIAEAGVVHGLALLHAGAAAEAEVALERAYFQATAAGVPLVAAEAADKLAYVVGNELSRQVDGLRWVQQAEATLVALGEPATGPHRLAVLESRAVLQFLASDYQAAQSGWERALAGQLERLGPGHPALAHLYGNLARVQDAQDHLGEARSLYERAVAHTEASLGVDHPEYAARLARLVELLIQTGETAEAIAMQLRAIEILERAFGPDHPSVVDAHAVLADAYTQAGRFTEARALYDQALAASEKLRGPESYDVAMVLNSTANMLYKSDRASEGLQLHRRALQIFEKALGPDHPDLGAKLKDLATQELKAGDDLDARAHFERARVILEAQSEPDHPHLVASLRGLAVIATRDRRHEEAIVLAERVLALRTSRGAAPDKLADARLVLAEALVGAGREPDRARALAEAARAVFHEAGDQASRVAQADALLARPP